jgi:hypothetical protein
MKDDLKLSQQSFNLSVKTRTYFSKRKVIGQPRGNLECGSAQPSLFHVTVSIVEF